MYKCIHTHIHTMVNMLSQFKILRLSLLLVCISYTNLKLCRCIYLLWTTI